MGLARRRRKFLAILALAALAVDFGASVLFSVYARSAYQQARPGTYPVAAVLHADDPPALSQTRSALDRAIELYQNGVVGAVFCVGGNRPWMERKAVEDMREHLVGRGVPRDRIVVERVSYDTRTNVQALAELARGYESVVIVVRPAHAVRVAYHARRAMPSTATIFVAPRAESAGLVAFQEDWTAFHHELAAWALTWLLSEESFDRLVRRLRSMDP